MAMRHAFRTVGDHEVHVCEWGNPTNPPLVMWHGLARTARDFDELAEAFSADWFVICPDTIGRGLSSWATEVEYSVSNYARIAVALLDAYGIDRAGWIGTSMGALIAMWIAASEDTDRLDWLVINDIGPDVPQEALDRILEYASGEPPLIPTVAAAEAALRKTYEPFGPASDEFWQRMARTSVRRLPDGALTTHYDPAMTAMMTTHRAELSVWDRWERISCPVHLCVGATSDILPLEQIERMSETGPKPKITWWEDCGHAPTLSRPADIDIVLAIVSELSKRAASARAK